MTSIQIAGRACPAPADSLHSAVTTLTHQGFRIVRRDASSATLTGPGLNSTRQNPLLGATEVNIRIANAALHLDAELGGVDFMRRFVTWFPLLLGLGLGLLFVVVGGVLLGQHNGAGFGVAWAQGWRWILVAMGAAMLPVLPWLLLSPMIARRILHSTQAAFETLVSNAGFAGNAASPEGSR
jgi:hypothetical protein